MKYRSNLKFYTGIKTARILIDSVTISPSTPGTGTSALINDTLPSTTTVYSSTRTENVIDSKVAQQLYDYDLLVSANLSI